MPRSDYERGFFHIMVQGINKKYIFEKSINKEEYLQNNQIMKEAA